MDYKKYVKDKKEHPYYKGEINSAAPSESSSSGGKKNFLGVRFECCSVYTRAYKNKAGTAYIARCPRCLKKVTIGINAQEGTDARFFIAR